MDGCGGSEIVPPELRPRRKLLSVVEPTRKIMKKIALILTLPLALSLVAVAAQKKDASKKSTESATSEEHVVLNPADLKWGGCASRITSRSETGGAGRRSKQEGTIHSAAANAGWLQNSAAYAPNR